MSSALSSQQKNIFSEIPPVNDFSGIYFYTINSNSDAELISILNQIISLNADDVSDWLNISPKTFTDFRNNPKLILRDNLKEHIILIISLYKHGAEVFGNNENFELWLSKKNIMLGGRAPSEFLDTVCGIKFIDDRLTGLEYGDNC